MRGRWRFTLHEKRACMRPNARAGLFAPDASSPYKQHGNAQFVVAGAFRSRDKQRRPVLNDFATIPEMPRRYDSDFNAGNASNSSRSQKRLVSAATIFRAEYEGRQRGVQPNLRLEGSQCDWHCLGQMVELTRNLVGRRTNMRPAI